MNHVKVSNNDSSDTFVSYALNTINFYYVSYNSGSRTLKRVIYEEKLIVIVTV